MSAPREPIAIVGIGCRFPGASSPEALWRLLIEGRCSVGEVPRDRFDLDLYYDPRPATPGKVSTRHGGFLENIDTFDADFFGIAPREAERLDPQQRLLLEVGFEALEDAGLSAFSLGGSPTGVFVGMWLNDFEGRLFSDPAGPDFYMTTGSGRYSASGRVSYAFGLQGPSLTIDAACASSLAAVHLACQSLWSGEAKLALAGGSNVILQPHISIAYSQSRMLAADGRCKFGDARADGYVRSEGAALVALKPLSAARRDGDRVYAVIFGGAVNNDGRTSGFMTTPGRGGQEDMLRKAYGHAGISPGQVGYVEAHGTGTRAGDPVELGALGTVLREGRPGGQTCAVGSVKTNIGHTEGAAGVAGLIKVALSLHHGIIPPSLHMVEPNPDIPWEELRLAIATEARPWSSVDGPAIAGVSSFGISGTNAHIVLGRPEGDSVPPAAPAVLRPGLLTLSARTPEALVEQARRFATWLSEEGRDIPKGDVAHTASRRSPLEYRLAVAGESREAWALGLEAHVRGESTEGMAAGRAREGDHRVVFVFPGQGGQWLGMGRSLLDREPAFRDAILECERAFRPYVDWSLVEELLAAPEASRLFDISVVQPTLFAVQVALAALWRSLGVEPAAAVGHSMGEAAAAFVSGALSLDAASRVICRRSELLKRISGQGAMAVVELSLDEASRAVAGYEDRVSVAVSNSSRSSVLSGDPEALDRILAVLEAREVFCRRVKVDVASHSPQVEPLMRPLAMSLGDLGEGPGRIPLWSTVTAAEIGGADLGPRYWGRNLREAVRFAATIRGLAASGYDTFIEMGPHPVLVGSIQQELAGVGGALAFPSLRREQDEQTTFLESLGAVYTSGVAVAWDRLCPSGRVVGLPTYAWQRERFWLESDAPQAGPRISLRTAAKPAAVPENFEDLYEMVWREAPVASAPVSTDGRTWVLVSASTPLALALENALTARGASVVRFGPAALASGDAWRELARARWNGDWSRCAGVVELDSLNAPTFADGALASLDHVSETCVPALLALVQSLAADETAKPPRVYVVTAGTQAVTSLADVDSPAAGLLWGLGRVIGGEHPELRATNIDLPSADAAPALSALCDELLSDTTENQVALRGGRRYLLRLLPHASARGDLTVERTRWRSPRPAEGRPFRAAVRRAGSVEGLALEEATRHAPGPGQVEIEVVASGLNFMNALSVLGVYPGAPDGVGPLGGEATGRVAAVGEGVSGLRPGDPVMAVALDSLATHAHTDRRLVVPLPSGLDFEQAATLPIAFLTALHALDSLARLRPGETVLIHAATGGVGLAALQVARARGARVFASAGSPEKREWLRTLGVEHIVDSRSLDFGDPLLEATGGRGVDVVLNSLAGEFVDRGLAVLAPGGRFIELGKRDIHEGRPLDLGLFRKGIGFFAVDLERMIREDPEAVGRALAEIREGVEQGIWRPLQHRAFPASRAREGLLALAQAQHLGKVIVRLDDPQVEIDARAFDPRTLGEGTCLVTGGLGALGLVSARFLVDAGARHLALVGRRSPTAEATSQIEALRGSGAEVRVMAADLSSREQVAELVGAIEREMPPLLGVIHAAGILDDATLATLTLDSLGRVLAGKVAGAFHLHELTSGRPLDFFVLYSSVAPLIGSPGQASYAAANAALDALAAFRRGRRGSATSINWGPWAEIGLAAADEKRGARLSDRGLPGLESTHAIALLSQILGESPIQAVAATFDWPRFQQAQPEVGRWPFFSEVARSGEGGGRAGSSLRESLLGVPAGHERIAALEQGVRALVARVLRRDVARIDPSRAFRALGLDSLMGLELRGQLEAAFGVPVPATLVWNYPNVQALARELARRALIPLEEEAAAAPSEPRPSAVAETAPDPNDLGAMLAQLEQMSDEEAQRLLTPNAEEGR